MSPWTALIIFFVVVLVIWWLLSRQAKEHRFEPESHDHESEPEPDETVIEDVEIEQTSEEVVEEQPAESKPVEAAEPPADTPPVEPDNLTLIEGIGPKINSLLQEAGISTFAQLAAVDVQKIDDILDTAGLTFANASSWPEQAKLAADGNWETLAVLQENLKGGRKVE